MPRVVKKLKRVAMRILFANVSLSAYWRCKMSSSAQQYVESLRALRANMVSAMRQNNAWEGFKRTLSDLYPDEAHFIYELLQNAEDAQATKVEFELFPDKL